MYYSLDKHYFSPVIYVATSFGDWKLIDEAEKLNVMENKPREKITSFDEMFEIIRIK